MQDTTFGNVKADLSYEGMIGLVEQLNVGDTIKFRSDLQHDCHYCVDKEGAFGEIYTNTLDTPRCGEECEIQSIDRDDKSLEVCDFWIPYNMLDIDWLVEQKKEKPTIETKEEEPHECKCVEDFYKQAQELNEIAHKELEEAVDKLNEAISKINSVNKNVSVTLSNGDGMLYIKNIEIKYKEQSNIFLDIK